MLQTCVDNLIDLQASDDKALKTRLRKWAQLIVCVAVVSLITKVLSYRPSVAPIGMGRREPSEQGWAEVWGNVM